MKITSRKLVSIIFLCALAVRLVLVTYMPSDAPDSKRYITLARNILHNQSFSYDGATPTDERAPGYSAFIAGVYFTFGESQQAVRITQAVLDSITCVLIFLLAMIIVNNRLTAALVSLLAVLHPSLCASTTFILSETLAVFTLTLALLTLIIAVKRRQAILCFLAGTILAGATLVRPVSFPFPLFLAGLCVPLYIKDKKLFLHMSVFIVGFALMLAPWIVRNYAQFNKFIPVSSNAGGNLFIGSMPEWNGTYNPEIVDIRKQIEERIAHEGPGHYPVDDYLKKEAIERITKDPVTYARLCVRKLGELWLQIPGQNQFLNRTSLLKIAIFMFHYTVLGLFIFSLFNAWRDTNLFLINLVMLSIIVLFTGLHVLLVALPRYLIPVEPMILVFCGYGIQKLRSIIRPA